MNFSLEPRLCTEIIKNTLDTDGGDCLFLSKVTKDFKQTFNFSQANLIKSIHSRKSRCLLESATISHSSHAIKQHPSIFHILPFLVNIILWKNDSEIDYE